MKTRTERILSASCAAVLIWLGSAGDAPSEMKSKPASRDTDAARIGSATKLATPETETGQSPSVSPSLGNTTAPSWEGEAPSGPSETPQVDSTTESVNSSALYVIPWQVVSAGGETSISPSYMAHQTLGQEAIGSSASAQYSAGQGYWYGAPTSAGPPGCPCDCHADPAPIVSCDGVQDVLDVVQTVNVAFRGAASILDPNPSCQFETTDVDCSLATDVIDVVKMVNVAFRGFTPSSQFCDTCP